MSKLEYIEYPLVDLIERMTENALPNPVTCPVFVDEEFRKPLYKPGYMEKIVASHSGTDVQFEEARLLHWQETAQVEVQQFAFPVEESQEEEASCTADTPSQLFAFLGTHRGGGAELESPTINTKAAMEEIMPFFMGTPTTNMPNPRNSPNQPSPVPFPLFAGRREGLAPILEASRESLPSSDTSRLKQQHHRKPLQSGELRGIEDVSVTATEAPFDLGELLEGKEAWVELGNHCFNVESILPPSEARGGAQESEQCLLLQDLDDDVSEHWTLRVGDVHDTWPIYTAGAIRERVCANELELLWPDRESFVFTNCVCSLTPAIQTVSLAAALQNTGRALHTLVAAAFARDMVLAVDALHRVGLAHCALEPAAFFVRDWDCSGLALTAFACVEDTRREENANAKALFAKDLTALADCLHNCLCGGPLQLRQDENKRRRVVWRSAVPEGWEPCFNLLLNAQQPRKALKEALHIVETLLNAEGAKASLARQLRLLNERLLQHTH